MVTIQAKTSTGILESGAHPAVATIQRAAMTCRGTDLRRGGSVILTVALACAAALLAVAAPAHAQQEYEARGAVADSSGTGLPNAMVVALTREDSTLVKYTLSNRDGDFSLNQLPAGEYILQITLIGYETVRQDFTIGDADLDAGQVTMSVLAVAIDPLVVSIEHVPFINNRDTLSYNAAAFETPPNATVEDLLRRLPGIQVNDDGSITAQGEEVQNVLVDGKEFFGSDGTIATQNLPADAISQVDVYDKQSDMAEFTGIADGNEERTLDLKLREEAKVGYFGTTNGAFGSDVSDQVRVGGSSANDARYDGALNLNRFSPSGQYALIMNANNVNQRRGGRGGGGGGFTEALSVGANASNEFGEDNWVRSSYFFNTADNERNTTVQQQTLLSSSLASLVDRLSSSESDNRNHRLNLNGQIQLAEGNQLRLRANGNFGTSGQTQFTNQETHNADGGMLNSAITNYLTDADDLSGDAQVTWRKRLNDSGRSLVAEFQSRISDNEQLAKLSSEVSGLSRGRGGSGGSAETEYTLQEQIRDGRNWNNSVRLSLTQPMGQGRILEIFGRANATGEDRDNPVYDLVDGSRVLNERQSNGFERAYSYYNAGTRFNRNNESYRLVTGLQVRRSNLDGVIKGRDHRIANAYTHVLPNLDFRIELKESHNLNFRYNTSTREPSLTELQPFVNNTNPLNIYAGNPDLVPEYTHRLRGEYRFFDEFSFRNFFMSGNYTYTHNTIAQSRFYDDRGVQTRSPINTDASWSANVEANYGTPIRRLGLEVDVEYRISYSEGTELINLVANDNQSIRNTLDFEIENRNRDRVEVEVGANFSFNNARYSLNQELNRDYLNSNYSLDATFYPTSAWTIRTDLRYQVYDDNLYGATQFGEVENVARWNASILRRLLDNRVEIEFRARDLLNQNTGISISNNSNFIQESRTESLGRYFMLRVNYRLGTQFVRGGRGGGRGDWGRGR